jgi:hypothetical protein
LHSGIAGFEAIMRAMGYRIVAMAAAVAIAWSAFGCSSGKNLEPTLEGNLLRYNEADLVTFSVAGTANCSGCDKEDRFVGLMVEIWLKDDPTHDLAVGTFDGLGPFNFDGIRTYKGAAAAVKGKLYPVGDLDAPPLEASAEFEVPGEDGKAVAFQLNFSPAGGD